LEKRNKSIHTENKGRDTNTEFLYLYTKLVYKDEYDLLLLLSSSLLLLLLETKPLQLLLLPLLILSSSSHSQSH
jgi:hypothetical protein